MEYTKPWLSYDEQADLLERRGLIFDRQDLVAHLSDVGYYRLSGYWHIFKVDPKGGDESFETGTTFDRVWDLYTFDRQLRLLTLDAVERVEIYMRTQPAYRLGETTGPFGYLDRSSLPGIDQRNYGRMMSRCYSAYDRSKATFAEHFKEKYGDCHGLPPYWELVNLMEFGTMLTLFTGAPDPVKNAIATEVGVSGPVLRSWLLTLNTVRNICAHHDRLWNRRLGNKTKIPRGSKYPEWHDPFEVGNGSTFTVLTVLGFMLEHVAPSTSWYGKSRKMRLWYDSIWFSLGSGHRMSWGRWARARPLGVAPRRGACIETERVPSAPRRTSVALRRGACVEI